MRKAAVFGAGRVLAALLAAVGLAADGSGWSPFGATHTQVVAAFVLGAVAFVGLTVWREVELYLASAPNVKFIGFDDVNSNPVTFVTRDGDQVTRDVRPADFRRLQFANDVNDPNEDSTARKLSAKITVRNRAGDVADCWIGRWSVLKEISDPADKWEADRLDLFANGQQAVLDVVMRYCGTTAMMGWDNSLSAGMGPRPELRDDDYSVEVALRAANMRARTWVFRLESTADSFRMVPSGKGSAPAGLRRGEVEAATA